MQDVSLEIARLDVDFNENAKLIVSYLYTLPKWKDFCLMCFFLWFLPI